MLLYTTETPVSAAFAPHQLLVERLEIAACPDGWLELTRRTLRDERPIGQARVERLKLPAPAAPSGVGVDVHPVDRITRTPVYGTTTDPLVAPQP